MVGEVGYLVHAENNAPGLPGRYRVGGYYDSRQYGSLSNPGHEQTGNYGFYVMGEQMVFRDGGPGSAKGLSFFGALIYAPRASTNPLRWFSRYLPGQTYELVLEWTYAVAVRRRLTIQPDIQYVINPGGVSSVGNALVLGAQLAIEF